MNKKISVLSPFFFPEKISTGKYNTKLVEELAAQGHKISVFCSYPIYPDWKPVKEIRDFDNGNVLTTRGGGSVHYPKNPVFRRFILEIWYSFFVLRHYRKINRSDVLVSIYPPSLFSLFIFPFLRKNVFKVAIVHDLQEVYAKRGGQNPMKRFIASMINKVERFAFRNSDTSIFLSKEMQAIATSLYNLNNDKTTYQYPFVSIKKVLTEDIDFIDEKFKSVVYSGALGEKQYPETLFQLFDEASKNLESTKFYIISGGPIFERLKEGNKNPLIIFKEFVPEKNIYELYHKSNLQIIPQAPGTSIGSLPSKLPNLLFSGTKTLVITDEGSEISQLYQKMGLSHQTHHNWELSTLISKMENILNNKHRNSPDFKLIEEWFSIKSLTNKIVK